MKVNIDKERFGPWALITGASRRESDEFARQIAASGINVVLVARREALLAELGVYVTVLAAGFTNTAVLEKFGFDPKTMPLKPMSVEQCVSEGLRGLQKNRSRIVPGRLNRIMNALVPASLARKMEADMLGKGLASKSASASSLVEA